MFAVQNTINLYLSLRMWEALPPHFWASLLYPGVT